MKDIDFRVMRQNSTIRRFEMADAKSIEYTRGNADDRLCNFKRMAEETEHIADPTYRSWANYFLKHIDAIWEYLKTRKQGTEGITSRIDDAHNYLDMLEGLVREGDISNLANEEKNDQDAMIVNRVIL